MSKLRSSHDHLFDTLRNGQKLLSLCWEIRNLSGTTHVMALIIESIWNKIKVQVGLLKEFRNSPSLLPSWLQSHYAVTISHLNTKLLGALSGFEKCRMQRLLITSQFARVKTLYLTRI